MASIQTCERQWALRYLWGYRQKKDNKWAAGGTLFHTEMQYVAVSRLPKEKRPAWATHDKRLNALSAQAQGDKELRDKANEAAAQYVQTYGLEEDPLYPVYIEEEFSATLGEIDSFDADRPRPDLDDEIVTCRTDLVAKNTRAGGIWILDYKTIGISKVSKKTGNMFRWNPKGEYALDWQVLINLHLVRATLAREGHPDAFDVRGFIIQRATREPDRNGRHDFDRHVLVIPPIAYKEAARAARLAVIHEVEVRDRIEAGGKPNPSYHACWGQYGPCDYRNVCIAEDKEQQAEILAADFKRIEIPWPRGNASLVAEPENRLTVLSDS